MQELDEIIIKQAISGDKMAFRSIVLHYGKVINRLAFRFTSNTHSAEDIAQETFIKAYKAIGKFKFDAKFSTWLYRITSNASIDYLRKTQRHSNNESLDETLQIVQKPTEVISLGERIDLSRHITTALSELSDVERLAFTMKHHQGYSIQETAQVLKINNNACKQTIYRAVQKLRKHLTPLVST